MNRRRISGAARAFLLCFLIVILVAALAGIPSLLFHRDYIQAAGNLAITRSFQPLAEDSRLDETSKNTNYGADEFVPVMTGSKQYRGIWKFNISSIPSGSTGISATLSLYFFFKDVNWTAGTTRTYDAHRVTADWVEADVSWNKRIGTTGWGTAGGDFNATVTDNQSTTGTGVNAWMDWTVTADAANFISGATANYGWLIKDSAEGSATDYELHYRSSEYTADTSLRPKLAVTWTAPWESYEDPGHTTVRDDYTASFNTVFMQGTSFATDNYSVGYFDGGDTFIVYEDVSVGASGNLTSQYLLTTDKSAVDGTWHVLVQPAAGYTTFLADYTTTVNDPDTYGLLANDSFTVQPEAIPEFPIVAAGIVVAGLCAVIYYWMRKRKLAYVKA